MDILTTYGMHGIKHPILVGVSVNSIGTFTEPGKIVSVTRLLRPQYAIVQHRPVSSSIAFVACLTQILFHPSIAWIAQLPPPSYTHLTSPHGQLLPIPSDDIVLPSPERRSREHTKFQTEIIHFRARTTTFRPNIPSRQHKQRPGDVSGRLGWLEDSSRTSGPLAPQF